MTSGPTPTEGRKKFWIFIGDWAVHLFMGLLLIPIFSVAELFWDSAIGIKEHIKFFINERPKWRGTL